MSLLVALRAQSDGVFHRQGEEEALTRSVFTEPLERLLRDGIADGSLREVEPLETAAQRSGLGLVAPIDDLEVRRALVEAGENLPRARRNVCDLVIVPHEPLHRRQIVEPHEGDEFEPILPRSPHEID
jgi:hypothetical protein